MREEIKLMVAILGMALFSFIVVLANASEQSYSAGAPSIKPTVIAGVPPDVTRVVTDTAPLPSAGGSNTGSASAGVTNMTNQFGRYTIDDIPVAIPYPVEPSHKRFVSNPRVIGKKKNARDLHLPAE